MEPPPSEETSTQMETDEPEQPLNGASGEQIEQSTAESSKVSTPPSSKDVEMCDADNSQSEPANSVKRHQVGDEFRDADGGIRIDDIYIEPPPPPSLTFDAEGPRQEIMQFTEM